MAPAEQLLRLRSFLVRRYRSHPALAAHGVLTFVCLTFYLPAVAHEYVVNDVLSASLASWRIADVGHGWFDGLPLADVPRGPGQELWVGTATNGHTVVFRSPGAIALGIPAYLVAGPATSIAEFSVLPTSIWAAVLSVLALNLLLASLRPIRRERALLSVLALGLTTPMWTVNANSLWPHAATVLGIAGMAWAASKERWWLVGAFGGMALWGRLHMVVVVAVLGLGLSIWRKEWKPCVRIAIVSGAFLGLATIWTHWMYGDWKPSGGYAGPSAYVDRAAGETGLAHLMNAAGLLFSPDRGLLVWTPVIVLLTPSVVRCWGTLPEWTRLLLFGGVLYTVIQAMMNGFTGGSSFYGYRLTLELLVCLFPAYAYATGHIGPVAKRVTGPLLGLQFAAMAIGATSEGFFLVPDQAWHDNSLALALRTFPALSAWLALMILVGVLSTRVWTTRVSSSPVTASHE